MSDTSEIYRLTEYTAKLRTDNERLTALICDFLWAIGHEDEAALNRTAEQARCILKPTMQEISDEIEASEREFRPMRVPKP